MSFGQERVTRRDFIKYLFFSFCPRLPVFNIEQETSPINFQQRQIIVKLEPGDTLASVSQRWQIFGSDIESIKRLNQLSGQSLEGRQSLSIPIFIPETKDLSESPQSYQKITGKIGLDFLSLYNQIPRPSPPEQQFKPIQFSDEPLTNFYQTDWRTFQVRALKVFYYAKAFTPPPKYCAYTNELSLGSQRLGEYTCILHSVCQQRASQAQIILANLKMNDVTLSISYVKKQLLDWGLFLPFTRQNDNLMT